MSGHLNPGGQQFRDDDGAADPHVTAALAAYYAGQGSEQDALTALAAARLLVPVVAGVSMTPSHQVDLAVRLHLSADSWAGGDWQPAVNHVAQSIAARLAGRLRRGVEISVTRDPLGS